MSQQGWVLGGVGVVVLGAGVAGAVVHGHGSPGRTDPPVASPDVRVAQVGPVPLETVAAPSTPVESVPVAPPPVPEQEMSHAQPDGESVPAPKREPTEEETLREALLESARKMGSCIQRMGKMDQQNPDQAEAMMIMSDVMKAMSDLSKTPRSMESSVVMALLDSLLPEGLGITDAQRARAEGLFKDLEQGRAMYGLSSQSFFSIMPPSGKQALTQEQKAQETQLMQAFSQGMDSLLTPAQKDHLKANSPGGGGGVWGPMGMSMSGGGEPEPPAQP